MTIMTDKEKWTTLIKGIESSLRLRTFPVGIKFVSDENELKSLHKMQRVSNNSFTCQLITLARTYGWNFIATSTSLMPVCGNIMGLCDLPQEVKEGALRRVWCNTKEDAKKIEESIPRIPLAKFKALLIGPQSSATFEPDIVLFYGNPAQIILIVNALQFENYERLVFYCVGESSSCADTIAQCYLSKKPSLSIPCFGERKYGHAQDDELVIALPVSTVEKVKRNLEELAKRGIRYPIPYFGAQADLSSGLPPLYHELLNLKGSASL